jgi:hypothetical protein
MNEADKALVKQSYVENDWDRHLDTAKLIKLIRADEREACAKVVLDMKGQCWAYDHDQIAAAIRARSET